jgi:FkbM family methyltransferase
MIKKLDINMIFRRLIVILYKNIVSLWLVKHKFPYLYELFLKLVLNNFKNNEDMYVGELYDHEMYFLPIHLGIFLNGEYEPNTTNLFLKTISKGDLVLDIGANIGLYTLLAARIVGQNGKVYAFEPDPKNYDLLLKNIKINGYKNVVPIQKAVSDRNEIRKLFLRENTTMNSLSNNLEDNCPTGFINVETITVDNFFENKSPANLKLIKMDIEGAEMLALLGMSRIIETNKNLSIITEFNPTFIKKLGYSSKEFIKKIHDYGFKINVIDSNKLYLSDLINNENPELNVNLYCYK